MRKRESIMQGAVGTRVALAHGCFDPRVIGGLSLMVQEMFQCSKQISAW
jgi:hypothetical protein